MLLTHLAFQWIILRFLFIYFAGISIMSMCLRIPFPARFRVVISVSWDGLMRFLNQFSTILVRLNGLNTNYIRIDYTPFSSKQACHVCWEWANVSHFSCICVTRTRHTIYLLLFACYWKVFALIGLIFLAWETSDS